MPLRIVIDARRIKDFGPGTYIRNLIAALAKLDRENQYIVVMRPPDARELAGLPGNFETAPYQRLDSRLFDNLAFPLFLKKFGADLYHVPVNVAPMFMPRPYVITVHDMSSLLFRERSAPRNNLHLYRFRRSLLRADRVIAVSSATRRDVENLLRIPPERIRRIYNAPDPKFLEACSPADARLTERRRTLERYQVNYPFLLYAGAIRPQKNVPRLVEAFAVLRGDLEGHPLYKDLRLIIIGDEIQRYPSVRRAVIQTRVEHVVRFLGFVPFDTLRVFYEAASAFVFPSLYEGFGLPPLEAMACGTPVIASKVSSLAEVVGDAALIVNPENVFDIARGVREALLDDDLRGRLVARGFERLKLFSWENTAREVLETYLEVASQKSRLAA